MKVFAPGKLILSGEHSVLYGKPALAMAVNRYVIATVTAERLPRILLDLSDLTHRSHLSFGTLSALKDRVKRKYHRFIRGDFTIREVLQKPFELAQFALGIFAESLNLSLPHGIKIHVQSDIPIGCGMGSSAATILSVIHAISHYLEVPLSGDRLFELALQAENMQHGHSSGLDLRVAQQGGCLYMHGDLIKKRTLPPSLPIYLVNTGTPKTTTGQCVEKVASHFKRGTLLDEFAAVTMAMDEAITVQSKDHICKAIRDNHHLLIQIGVVPKKVQQFIADVEAVDGAAKVCGAGSVSGERAGALLVVADNKRAILSLCTRFGYAMIPVVLDTRGVYAI